MIIAITEHNAWENERWTYILDMSKQKAEAINYLMIFIRLANEYYQEVRENCPPNPLSGHIFMRHCPKIFAASHYRIEFYDSVIASAGTRTRLSLGTGEVSLPTSCNGYKSAGLMLYEVISPKKAKSALVAIREKNIKKKRNLLYKNFESIFLSKKTVDAISKTKKVV